jgi:hypothetical protein
MKISFTPASVSLFMSEYITKALQRFRPQYLLPTHRAAATPGKYHAAIYPRIQLVKEDLSPLLTPTQRTEIQAIVGTLLYYARAVDPSLLPIANEIASQQANPTQEVLTAANRALSYASARQNNFITYHACDMVLFLHVDASYLSRSHARSVVGGYFFLGMGNENRPYISTVLPTSSLASYLASSPVPGRQNTLLFSLALNTRPVCATFWQILATLNPRLSSCVTIPVLSASLQIL